MTQNQPEKTPLDYLKAQTQLLEEISTQQKALIAIVRQENSQPDPSFYPALIARMDEIMQYDYDQLQALRSINTLVGLLGLLVLIIFGLSFLGMLF